MEYAELNPRDRLLKPYYDLTPSSNRQRAMDLGVRYMSAIEHVLCPTCEKGDKGRYDAENQRCVKCWYKQLAHISEEVARDAG